MSSTKVYRSNYKHKHTLKYIRSVVEKYLDPKFEFEFDDMYKSFTFADKSDRITDDWSLDEGELKSLKDKVYLSYTVQLKKEKPIYTEHDLLGYIDLLGNLVEMSKEFEKNNLLVVPNTVDDEMDFDIIEEDSLFYISLDNNKIYDYTENIGHRYKSFENRQYYPAVDSSKFYNIKLSSTYSSDNEHNREENIEHFEKYLTKECKDEGLIFVKNKNKTYNIYTKGQHRVINLKKIFKK